MDLFIYILIIALTLFCLWVLWQAIKKNPEDEAFRPAQKKRLDDERLYDPNSGEFISLEEVENGWNRNVKSINMPYSTEEIERVFYDQFGLAETHNWLVSKGYLLTESIDFSGCHDYLLDEEMIADLLSLQEDRIYSIKRNVDLLLLFWSPYNRGTPSYSVKLYGSVRLGTHLGDYIFVSQSFESRIMKVVDKENTFLNHSGWTVLQKDKNNRPNFIEEMLSCLIFKGKINEEVVDNVEIESSFFYFVKGHYIFCLSEGETNVTNTSKLVDSLLKLNQKFS